MDGHGVKAIPGMDHCVLHPSAAYRTFTSFYGTDRLSSVLLSPSRVPVCKNTGCGWHHCHPFFQTNKCRVSPLTREATPGPSRIVHPEPSIPRCSRVSALTPYRVPRGSRHCRWGTTLEGSSPVFPSDYRGSPLEIHSMILRAYPPREIAPEATS